MENVKEVEGGGGGWREMKKRRRCEQQLCFVKDEMKSTVCTALILEIDIKA